MGIYKYSYMLMGKVVGKVGMFGVLKLLAGVKVQFTLEQATSPRGGVEV
jgi:hypothetical protein